MSVATLPQDLTRFLVAQDGPSRRSGLGNYGHPGWTLTLRFDAARTVDLVATRDDGLPVPTAVLSGPSGQEPDLELRRLADHAAETVAQAEYDRAKSTGLTPLDAVKVERFRATLPKETVTAAEARTALDVLEALKAEGYPVRSQKVHRVALSVARKTVDLNHHRQVVAELETRVKDSDVAIGELADTANTDDPAEAPARELEALKAKLEAVTDLARTLHLIGPAALDYVPGRSDVERVVELLDGALQS